MLKIIKFRVFAYVYLFISLTSVQAQNINCEQNLLDPLQTLVSDSLSSGSPSLPFSLYGQIDLILACHLAGSIDSKAFDAAIEILRPLQQTEVPLLVGDIDGIRFWNEDETISALGSEIMNTMPYILNQLNSSIIVLTPSELEQRQTYYNFESDLNLGLFATWDRRNCFDFDEDRMRELEARMSQPRILPNQIHSHTYIVLAMEAIKVRPDGVCMFNMNTQELNCDPATNSVSSIIHENAHLIETRFPLFYSLFHDLPGGRNDRLNRAKEVVPGYGTSACTYAGLTDSCIRAITQAEVQLILNETSLVQDAGSRAGVYYAQDVGSERDWCGDGNLLLKKNGTNYCVWLTSDSLYALDRDEEYIPVMIEAYFTNRAHYLESTTHQEQQAMSALLQILGID
jgi:hypothetical protein